MATRHPAAIRDRVVSLGRAGWTYSELQKEFSIPKSTLSFWFKTAGKPIDRSRQLAHLAKARERAYETIRNGRLARIAVAEDSASQIAENVPVGNRAVLKALLAMLYWAEGTKSDTSGGPMFVNTDPLLAEFYLSMLREAYDIDEKRLRIRVHIHDYHDPVAAVRFWSKLLKVPESQFGKIYVKKRSEHKKFRENFQGICFVGYYDTHIRRELLALGRIVAKKQLRSRS